MSCIVFYKKKIICFSSVKPTYPANISDKCRVFLDSCLICDPEKRKNADQLLKSDFLICNGFRDIYILSYYDNIYFSLLFFKPRTAWIKLLILINHSTTDHK